MNKLRVFLFAIIFLSTLVYPSENDKNYNVLLIQTNNISSDLNNIKRQNDLILESTTDKSVNIVKEILIPTGLSIFAGFVFWIVFQAIPLKFRKLKLRTKIEKDLLLINYTLVHLMDISMIHTENPVSLFDNDLTQNNFTKELFEIGLMNKALNESYLVGPFSNNIVIGEKIYNYVNTIDTKIERLFNFSDQLSVKEILILEDIHQVLSKWGLSNFNRPYLDIDKVTGQAFTPRDPSLSYLSHFFFEIYQLRQKFIKILVTSIKSEDLFFIKYKYLENNKQFKKAIRIVKKEIKKNKIDKIHLKWILFSLLYRVDKNKSFVLLKEVVSISHIISYRNYIREYLDDQEIIEIIRLNTTPELCEKFFHNEAIETRIRETLLKTNLEKKKLVDY